MLVVVGLNHTRAPKDIRERAAFIKRTALEAMQKLTQNEAIEEAIILSTCNRSEIFVQTDQPETALDILRDYYYQMDPILIDYLDSYVGEEALVHLYRLACGLESMILGEDQILGQLKEAQKLANLGGFAGKFTNQFFREAITFAKRIKTEYKLSEVPTSVASTAVKFIKHTFKNSYQDKRILIVGSGKTGRLVLEHLHAEGFKNITMSNRTYHPGDEFEEIYQPLNIVEFKDRYESLKDTDVVITATSSPHTIFKKEALPTLDHEILFIDLAVPSDVEPAIETLDNIHLVSLDDFKEVIESGYKWQKQQAKVIEEKIDSAVEEVLDWAKHTRMDSIIGILNKRAYEQANQTIKTLNKRYRMKGKDLSYLEKIVRSNFRQLIRPVLLKLKELDSQDEIETIEDAVAILDVHESSEHSENSSHV